MDQESKESHKIRRGHPFRVRIDPDRRRQLFPALSQVSLGFPKARRPLQGRLEILDGLFQEVHALLQSFILLRRFAGFAEKLETEQGANSPGQDKGFFGGTQKIDTGAGHFLFGLAEISLKFLLDSGDPFLLPLQLQLFPLRRPHPSGHGRPKRRIQESPAPIVLSQATHGTGLVGPQKILDDMGVAHPMEGLHQFRPQVPVLSVVSFQTSQENPGQILKVLPILPADVAQDPSHRAFKGPVQTLQGGSVFSLSLLGQILALGGQL